MSGNDTRHATVYECGFLDLPQIVTTSGRITPVTGGVELPFEIERVYYLYDVPGGEGRGGHAHRALEQVLVAASGSFDVTLDDGTNRRTVTLNRPYFGLHFRPMIWRELSNFSSGGICLVLASAAYDEVDYIRTYEEFRALRRPSSNTKGG